MTVPNLHFCIFFQFSIQTLLAFACIYNEFVEVGISLPSINKLCKYSANKSKKKAEKSKAITFLRSLCSGNFLKDFFSLLHTRCGRKERKRFAADGRHFPPPFIDSTNSFAAKGTGSPKLHSKQKAGKVLSLAEKHEKVCNKSAAKSNTVF